MTSHKRRAALITKLSPRTTELLVTRFFAGLRSDRALGSERRGKYENRASRNASVLIAMIGGHSLLTKPTLLIHFMSGESEKMLRETLEGLTLTPPLFGGWNCRRSDSRYACCSSTRLMRSLKVVAQFSMCIKHRLVLNAFRQGWNAVYVRIE